jgi:hypothetical protein
MSDITSDALAWPDFWNRIEGAFPTNWLYATTAPTYVRPVRINSGYSPTVKPNYFMIVPTKPRARNAVLPRLLPPLDLTIRRGPHDFKHPFF